MITTIIITALVSVLSTLAIGYFIWQFISGRKLKKCVKDNKVNINYNKKNIENVESSLFQESNEIHNRITEIEENLENKIEEIEEIEDNIREEMENKFDTMYKKIIEISK